MASVKEIYEYLDTKCPFSLQMDFDNAGFLVGRDEQVVTQVLVALDITEDVIAEAKELGAELIVTHHPVIFHPVRSVTGGEPLGRKLLALIESGIAVISAHTNLDAVAGGVNDALAEKLGLIEVGQLHPDGTDTQGRPYGIGRVGETAVPQPLESFAQFVKTQLGSAVVRYADAGRMVHKVAVGGGACTDMIGDALAKGCDTFVTSDVKYNGFWDARELGLNLIDAGHFPTENVICPVLAAWLKSEFPQLEISLSKRHCEVYSCC